MILSAIHDVGTSFHAELRPQLRLQLRLPLPSRVERECATIAIISILSTKCTYFIPLTESMPLWFVLPVQAQWAQWIKQEEKQEKKSIKKENLLNRRQRDKQSKIFKKKFLSCELASFRLDCYKRAQVYKSHKPF